MIEHNSFAALTERLDRQRNQSLAWFMWSFLAWSFLQILVLTSFAVMGMREQEFLTWLFFVIGFIPMALWITFLIRFLWVRHRIGADPQVAEALRDEMVREAWLRAAAAGFWSMLAVEASFTILKVLANVVFAQFLGIPHLLIFLEIRSPLAIAVGLGVTIGTYLRLRRE